MVRCQKSLKCLTYCIASFNNNNKCHKVVTSEVLAAAEFVGKSQVAEKCFFESTFEICSNGRSVAKTATGEVSLDVWLEHQYRVSEWQFHTTITWPNDG